MVTVAIFSPDGNKIITGSSDRTLKLWDAKTGALLVQLVGPIKELWTAVFTDDGTHLISEEGDVLGIWDLIHGYKLAEFPVIGGWSHSIINEKDRFNEFLRNFSGPIVDKFFYDVKQKDLKSMHTENLRSFVSGSKNFINYSSHDLSISHDGRKIITASKDSEADVIGFPYVYVGDIIYAACEVLPDHDLSEIISEYGFTHVEPICKNIPSLTEFARYERAADAGNVPAMNYLGSLYDRGSGVAQDYAKAIEWYKKAAEAGNAQAMVNLGKLYESGSGMARDYAKAREWYEKAAAAGAGDAATALADLRWKPKRDAIDAAESTGRYADALALQESLTQEIEADEVKADGKPGPRTANELNSVSWYGLFSREFSRALAAAERAHSLAPEELEYEANHAHALMFLGREIEARDLYLSHKNETVAELGNETWSKAISDDFADLRKAGLTKPLMAEIETALGKK